MSWVAIGRQVGLSPDTIRLIAAGEHKKMTRHTAVKIAASRVDLAPGAFIDSTGTVRRIKALLALGWTHAHLGQHTGLATSPIIHQRNGRVTVRTAQTVSETFERLCMTPGPSPLTRQRALNMGYHVPLAWDDIDDPDAAPAGGVPAPVDEVKVQRAVAGHRVDLNRDEREAAQTILEARGMCAREIAERVGRTPRTIVRRRSDRAA
jgi:predicted transcriptional regulator